MVRNSCYLTALLAVLTTLVAILARSQPLPAPARAIEPQATDNQQERANVPVCYIQLQNGQLRDLRQLCGKAVSPSSVRSKPNTVQRTILQSNPDSDDDDSAPAATPTPRSTPSQKIPGGSPTPQQPLTQPSLPPASSPNTGVPSIPDSPGSNPSLPATPVPNPPISPHPLAIPTNDSR